LVAISAGDTYQTYFTKITKLFNFKNIYTGGTHNFKPEKSTKNVLHKTGEIENRIFKKGGDLPPCGELRS